MKEKKIQRNENIEKLFQPFRRLSKPPLATVATPTSCLTKKKKLLNKQRQELKRVLHRTPTPCIPDDGQLGGNEKEIL